MQETSLWEQIKVEYHDHVFMQQNPEITGSKQERWPNSHLIKIYLSLNATIQADTAHTINTATNLVLKIDTRNDPPTIKTLKRKTKSGSLVLEPSLLERIDQTAEHQLQRPTQAPSTKSSPPPSPPATTANVLIIENHF